MRGGPFFFGFYTFCGHVTSSYGMLSFLYGNPSNGYAGLAVAAVGALFAIAWRPACKS